MGLNPNVFWFNFLTIQVLKNNWQDNISFEHTSCNNWIAECTTIYFRRNLLGAKCVVLSDVSSHKFLNSSEILLEVMFKINIF